MASDEALLRAEPPALAAAKIPKAEADRAREPALLILLRTGSNIRSCREARSGCQRVVIVACTLAGVFTLCLGDKSVGAPTSPRPRAGR